MEFSHKKWIVFGGLVLMLGGATLFLWKATSRSQQPAKPAAVEPKTADSPAHELKMLEAELQKKPGHLPVLMRMAEIERSEGKVADAEDHLRQAVTSEPSNPDAHLELGRLLYEKGDVSGAIQETQSAIAANPKHVDALYNMGAIYANTGDPAKARSYWNRAVQADPAAESGKKAREGLARIGKT